MKKYLPFIAAGGALAFLYFQGLKKTLTGLRANLVNIVFLSTKTKQSTYTRLYFKVLIAFENPNDSAVTITGANFQVSHNGERITTAQDETKIEIGAKSRTIGGFEIVIPVTKLFNVVADAIRAIMFKKAMVFNVNGEINAGAAVIKINESKSVQWHTA